jgi:hypothetical protein
MTKLTLSMDKDVIATAKRIAGRHRQSVSSMLSNVVKAMAAQEKRQAGEVPPDCVTACLRGVVQLPDGKPDRDLVAEALMERYGAGE